jgi:phenylacetate-CoA ligase
MEKITGRTDDMLIIRGVNVFPSQIEELLLADRRLSAHYVLELHRRGHLDDLEVVVELRADPGSDVEATRAACARDLRHHIKGMIGITAAVRVVNAGVIERSGGKARRVVDLRPKA